ncbi:integrase [Aliivibrio finisterrensis]|uniref:Integrase n=2 Tax=Aliivibrio finisterrensis TaxID=511998 RepID=A0A6N6RPJ3_9GAMM|nr:integrase [Aliivibrio finisterrensis]
MNRNMNARNFGLRSSNMSRALVTAYQMKENGDNSKNQCKTALNDFAKHLKEDQGINDLKKVEKSHVLSYANELNNKFENDQISASSAQNYLSKVNVALENARLDRDCRVDGVREAGLPKRTGIATYDHSVDKESHETALSQVPDRLSVQLELQRELGLRFKESSLIDAKNTLDHAVKNGIIRVENGTKGGKLREFKVSSDKQLTALKNAAAIQCNDRSLIPSDMKWSQYQSQCYREIQQTNIKFHGERHNYANDRYEKISGVKSPVRSQEKHGKSHLQYIANEKNITLADAKILDHNTRLQISNELGHERVSITNNYLG